MNIERNNFKKIFFHIDKLYEYINTGDTYPIHMLVGLTDYCNHNCLWCYTAHSTHNRCILSNGDNLNSFHKKLNDRTIDPDVFLKFLFEAKNKGLKAVTIAGSGESLLHPDSAYIMQEIAKLKLDFGIFSNGQILNDEQLKVIAKHATFFRFSLDASDPMNYKQLHGDSANFDQTIENIKSLLIDRNNLRKPLPTIGAQFLLSHLNVDYVISFTKLMQRLGIDYVNIRPLFYNPINVDRVKNKLSIDIALNKLKEAKQCETKNFIVYDKGGEQFQSGWGKQQFNEANSYQKCMSHQFSPALFANGNIYICSSLAGYKEFIMGNIYKSSLKEIWSSNQRQNAIASIDLHKKCPVRCQFDPLNKIIWGITNPSPESHPNFI